MWLWISCRWCIFWIHYRMFSKYLICLVAISDSLGESSKIDWLYEFSFFMKASRGYLSSLTFEESQFLPHISHFLLHLFPFTFAVIFKFTWLTIIRWYFVRKKGSNFFHRHIFYSKNFQNNIKTTLLRSHICLLS